jgi:methylaspartate ammonia-lyase
VQIVADEWCNTLADVVVFAQARCAHMIHVKSPDLGSLDDVTRSLIACRDAGVGAYCGGSGTDTERAGQLCAGLAMGVQADLLLARPGMGVDEAVMVVQNEMNRTRALIEARGPR